MSLPIRTGRRIVPIARQDGASTPVLEIGTTLEPRRSLRTDAQKAQNPPGERRVLQ
jgi:hypothetical protein